MVLDMLDRPTEFGLRAAGMVGMYRNPPENAVVMCVDEKPRIQALQRAQACLRLPRGEAENGFRHCCQRPGTTTLFAALEAATGPAQTARVSGLHE
jgi:hypothetical protein